MSVGWVYRGSETMGRLAGRRGSGPRVVGSMLDGAVVEGRESSSRREYGGRGHLERRPRGKSGVRFSLPALVPFFLSFPAPFQPRPRILCSTAHCRPPAPCSELGNTVRSACSLQCIVRRNFRSSGPPEHHRLHETSTRSTHVNPHSQPPRSTSDDHESGNGCRLPATRLLCCR